VGEEGELRETGRTRREAAGAERKSTTIREGKKEGKTEERAREGNGRLGGESRGDTKRKRGGKRRRAKRRRQIRAAIHSLHLATFLLEPFLGIMARSRIRFFFACEL